MTDKPPCLRAPFLRGHPTSCTVSRERGPGKVTRDSRWPPSPLASPLARTPARDARAACRGRRRPGQVLRRRRSACPFRARPISVSDRGGRLARVGCVRTRSWSLSEPRSGGCGTCCRHPWGRRASDASAVAWGWRWSLWRPSGN